MKSETRIPACLSRVIAGASWDALPGGVEAPLGGTLLAPFGNDASGVWSCFERDADHLIGRRHLQVERCFDLRLQARNVLVADVAAILAQMGSDAVGARVDRQLGRAYRIRMAPAARVADGGDVVDIDAETQLIGRHFQ